MSSAQLAKRFKVGQRQLDQLEKRDAALNRLDAAGARPGWTATATTMAARSAAALLQQVKREHR